jgi:hypothetical protein
METELIARLERLENHFKVYKTDVIDIKDSVKEIRLLLGGSALNGNKGFINLMENVERKVLDLELSNEKTQQDLQSIKHWGRGASGLLFAFILILINYVKDKL